MHRTFAVNSLHMARLTAQLSSGLRINRAGDDAAGLSISEKMRAQIRGFCVASKNSEDAISLVQTAEGALGVLHALLARIRELALQSCSDTNNDAIDRESLDMETQALIREIDDIAAQTRYNGIGLLDGSHAAVENQPAADTALRFLVGANGHTVMYLNIDNMDTQALGIHSLNVLTQNTAEMAIGQSDNAIKRISLTRAQLGAVSNRLTHTIDYLNNAAENLTDAESRIRDIDMAKAMTERSRVMVLMKAGTAMMVQAGTAALDVLSLLR
jgi:flagellin